MNKGAFEGMSLWKSKTAILLPLQYYQEETTLNPSNFSNVKKEGKHDFVLINYFLLPLGFFFFATLVYCPVCVAALKTLLKKKNLIHIL